MFKYNLFYLFIINYVYFKTGVCGKHNNKTDILPTTCDSLIYCQGKLLETIQMARIYSDSKTFVDMSMKHSEEDTLKKFKTLMKRKGNQPSNHDLEKFIAENFLSEKELDHWIPDDFTENPKFLSKIPNQKVKHFAQILIHIWKDLGRKVKREVFQQPEKYSLIPVPNGFIIPGGRFREYYYWDSYWIIEGLLRSEMIETVRKIIDNFIFMVKKFGYVPNGGRIYYTRRSQPPLLSFMARKYFENSKNINWLKNNIEYLDKEVNFWLKERTTKITYKNKEYELGYYICKSRGPRPESFYEDCHTAQSLPAKFSKQKLYDDLKAAAQSGWDFSSRWIFDEYGGTNANLTSIQTTRVAPADLNSYLHGACKNMAHFYTLLKNKSQAAYWESKASSTLTTLKDIFWHEEDGIWYDFDMHLKKPRRFFAASNLTPLWVEGYHSKNKQIRRVIDYLYRESIPNYPGGVPATKLHTGEQWDYPTTFPNLQSVIVQGLEKSGNSEAKELARSFAVKWVEAMMIGFEKTHGIFEKYDVNHPGTVGGGGEYKVQKGFGWTNGVTLDFIYNYYVNNGNK